MKAQPESARCFASHERKACWSRKKTGLPSGRVCRLRSLALLLAIFFRFGALIRGHLVPQRLPVLLRPVAIGIGRERRTHPAISLHAVARYAGAGGVHRGQTIAGGRIFLGGRGLQQHHGLLATARHTIALYVHVGQANRRDRIALGRGLPQPRRFGNRVAGVVGLDQLLVAGNGFLGSGLVVVGYRLRVLSVVGWRGLLRRRGLRGLSVLAGSAAGGGRWRL